MEVSQKRDLSLPLRHTDGYFPILPLWPEPCVERRG